MLRIFFAFYKGLRTVVADVALIYNLIRENINLYNMHIPMFYVSYFTFYIKRFGKNVLLLLRITFLCIRRCYGFLVLSVAYGTRSYDEHLICFPICRFACCYSCVFFVSYYMRAYVGNLWSFLVIFLYYFVQKVVDNDFFICYN